MVLQTERVDDFLGYLARNIPATLSKERKKKGPRSILDQFQSVFPTDVLPRVSFLWLLCSTRPSPSYADSGLSVGRNKDNRWRHSSDSELENTKKHKEISHVTSRVTHTTRVRGRHQRVGLPHLPIHPPTWSCEISRLWQAWGVFFLVNCSISDLI